MEDDAVRVFSSSLKKIPRSIIIVLVVLVLAILFHPWVQIGAGERGVVLNFIARGTAFQGTDHAKNCHR
jgi:hypothetical protein